MSALLGHPLLRPIILSATVGGLCLGGMEALVVLYATRDLHFGPLVLGLIFATGGACAIPGALLAARAARRWGIGPAILGGWTLEAASWLLIPLAAGPVALVVATLAAGRALEGLAGTVANIHQWSPRQAVTPDALQGRVTASQRFLVYGATSIGALLGVLATRLALVATPLRGLRATATSAAIFEAD